MINGSVVESVICTFLYPFLFIVSELCPLLVLVSASAVKRAYKTQIEIILHSNQNR